MKRFFVLLLLATSIIITACEQSPRARQAKFYAFGTEIDVSLFGVDETAAKNTVDALEKTFSHVNDQWHAWRPSTLSDINKAIAKGENIQVSTDVAELIQLAASYAEQSQNLFNPAAGKLFELWGFHQDDWFESHPPPHARSNQCLFSS